MKRTLAAFAAVFMVTTPAATQEWPTAKPIRIVAPSTPGGAADMFGRLLADNLPAMVGGGRFVVENRAGAGGLIGTAAVAQAPGDGYTFGIAGIAYQVIAPAAAANPGFDPMKDFSHIAYIGGPPNVFVVSPSIGVRSLAELIAFGKKRDAVDYVSPGVGTLGHLMMEYFARKAGIKVQQIMTSGASQGMMDIIAGNVQVGTMTWTSALGQIRANKVIPIAVSSGARLTEAPDVPTFKELGYDDLTTTSWFGFSGPARLPAGMPQRLNTAVLKILEQPDVRARLQRDSIETRAMSSEEFTSFVAGEIRKWGPLAKELMPKR
jgi:tripartite-type tricarboxylate transporter receptor subunit TctC